RLWRVLAEAALDALDLDTAEKAGDNGGGDGGAYAGLRLIKRLRLLSDKMKQKAEVAAYFGRLDEAEALYRETDRKDLAVGLRQRQGDHFRVVQLVKQGGGNDRELSEAWGNIARHYADRCRWRKASQYFEQIRDLENACDCHFRAGDFARLREAAAAAADGAPLLATLGKRFEAVGMAEDAVAAYLKVNRSCLVL
ncbi:unnamed protein product, partial [Phaeothamnion confervicola]